MTADEVLKIVYGDEIRLPIDPFEIAHHFDIKVFKLEDCDVQGLSEFDGENIKIHYKPTHENRDRFTIAHELGHIFLHFLEGEQFAFQDKRVRDGFSEFDDNDSKDISPVVFQAAREEKPTSIWEREANMFAGELLIPKTKIIELRKKLESNQRYLSSKLCNYFRVSNGTMFYTLKAYGEWDSMVKDDHSW